MSVFVLEAAGPGALAAVVPRLSPDARRALEGARVVRVRIDTVNASFHVDVQTAAPLSADHGEELEAALAALAPGARRVEVRTEATSPGPPTGGVGPAGSEGEAPPPGDPPPEPGDDVLGMDDDDYLRYVLERAANGPPLVHTSGHDAAPRNGGGMDGLFTAKIDGDPIPLAELQDPRRDCVIEGEVLTWESRAVRGGHLISFDVSDKTDSITVKHFAPGEANGSPSPAPGSFVRVRGRAEVDRFTDELVMSPSAWTKAQPALRTDDYPRRRVELHLHTKMSSLDGAADTKAVIRQAAAWGHPAVAVTDHGVVHAFPEAYSEAKRAGIKLIYGMEGYLVEDEEPRGRAYHIVLLAANPTGLRHLYELVSLSHLEHFYRQPRIPRSEIAKRREGLIVGSACEAGDLYQAILTKEPEERIVERAKFYDYLEIQPIGNNRFLVDDGTVADEEGLRDINRRIVALGRQLGLPVVATSDAHFVHPEDEIFRRILMAGHGFSAAERPTPLYLRTTEEMLEEFSYLGEEGARAVVIEAPNTIAARCEEMPPVRPGLHAPSIPKAAEEVERIARETAARIYGDPLPRLVEARLERELKAIVDNGFAPLYYISYDLVRKSVEDGYLVGSRGSVGSSVVATLCGITEVNPLPPHYVCPACSWSRFFVEGEVGCGVDLPDESCPECGHALDKDGFDIPFETFMGFHGDKVPDIDLNFSGEYQGRAHEYAERLLGAQNVYRAGTIATMAERTAYGYVRKFLDTLGQNPRNAEVNRLVRGCSGVRRTTGQHPGGLMVVPRGHDIHEFTPVQYPANDRNAGVVTTHFEYRALDENLVKLDILAHDDPTILRMLADLTGVDVQKVPLDDGPTMALFSGVESLGVQPRDIGTSVGTLGVPEFGTGFVRQMLEDTRPKTFEELVRISGLSHGTNVWLNNAQDLVRQKRAELKDVIATRDDIMTFLILKGMDSSDAFRIMEQVRRGRGLTPEDEQLMRKFDLPPWYIDSCQKISYMFPKAHAAAYVMMAFRIAYFKVHHKEAFYAATFTVKAEECDADLLVQGREGIRKAIDGVERKGNEATAREKSLVTVMQIALEALARGVRFRPVHLYESDARRFLVTPEGLLPPLVSLHGIGYNAAEGIARARTGGEFTSIEDVQKKSGVTRGVVDALRAHGALEGLPETDQLTLF